jgi:hypothetical protein
LKIYEDTPQRRHILREVFNALLWIAASCFEAIVHDLRAPLLWADDRAADPKAVILDSGPCKAHRNAAGGGIRRSKRCKGSKTPAAMDTLGQLLELHVTPANLQERDQRAILAAVQEADGNDVVVAVVDQGHTGEEVAVDSTAHGPEADAPPPGLRRHDQRHGQQPALDPGDRTRPRRCRSA